MFQTPAIILLLSYVLNIALAAIGIEAYDTCKNIKENKPTNYTYLLFMLAINTFLVLSTLYPIVVRNVRY